MSVSLSLSSPITDETPYEVQRAQELNSLLGPKGSEDAVEIICDLHNTTANMGLTIISYSDKNWICLHIFKHLKVSVMLFIVNVSGFFFQFLCIQTLCYCVCETG